MEPATPGAQVDIILAYSFNKKEWLREKITCPKCYKTVQRQRKREHMHITHGIIIYDKLTQTNEKDVGTIPGIYAHHHLNDTERTSQPYVLDQYDTKCPIFF